MSASEWKEDIAIVQFATGRFWRKADNRKHDRALAGRSTVGELRSVHQLFRCLLA
jgi:hypothetical protein